MAFKNAFINPQFCGRNVLLVGNRQTPDTKISTDYIGAKLATLSCQTLNCFRWYGLKAEPHKHRHRQADFYVQGSLVAFNHSLTISNCLTRDASRAKVNLLR